jgi:hypothetical protein
METKIINGEEVRVNRTERGTMYSKNFRSLKAEADAAGTREARIVPEKKAFFLGGNAYYIGPSLQGKNEEEIASIASQIQICESSVDGTKWVPCLFLPSTGKTITLKF